MSDCHSSDDTLLRDEDGYLLPISQQPQAIILFEPQMCDNAVSMANYHNEGHTRVIRCSDINYPMKTDNWCISCILSELFDAMRHGEYEQFHRLIWKELHARYMVHTTPLSNGQLYGYLKQHVQSVGNRHNDKEKCLFCFRDVLLGDDITYASIRIDDRAWFPQYFKAGRPHIKIPIYHAYWRCSLNDSAKCEGCKDEYLTRQKQWRDLES